MCASHFLIPLTSGEITCNDHYHYLYDSLLEDGLVNYCISIIPQTKEEFFINYPNYAAKFYGNAKAEHKNILTENKDKSGIYLWYNSVTKKYYIGQSKNLGDVKTGRLARYFRHSYLESKVRGESLIRKAILKYGLENLSLLILEYCPIDLLDQQEQAWIDLLNPYYNILKLVKTSRVYKHTELSLSQMRGCEALRSERSDLDLNLNQNPNI